jgi:hypothetical protein
MPTMNPTLVIRMRTEPFSAYDTEGTLESMTAVNKKAEPNLIAR